MRKHVWIVLLLLLAAIGCRSSAKKVDAATPPLPATPSTNPLEEHRDAPPLPESVPEAPRAVVEVVPPVEVLPEAPLTPEEEAEVAALQATIAELERVLAEGKKEIHETLARLRGNREKKLGRIRAELQAAGENFNRDLEEVRIVKGGEHHGE